MQHAAHQRVGGAIAQRREPTPIAGLGGGETIAETCLPLEYRRANAAKEPPVTSFSLRFWRWDTQQMLRPTFRRPAAGS